MRRRVATGRVGLLLVPVLALSSIGSRDRTLAADETPGGLRGAPLGIETGAAGACSLAGRSEDEPLPVVVAVDPSVEADVEALLPLLECAGERFLSVVVRLEVPEERRSGPDPAAALAPWIESLERFLQKHRQKIAKFEIGAEAERDFDPRIFGYLIEKAGTLLRSFDPEARLAMGPFGAGAEDWLPGIAAARITPYVDAIAFLDPVDIPAAAGWTARQYPAMSVWAHFRSNKGAAALLATISEARKGGARVVFSPPSPEVRSLVRCLPSRFIPDPDPVATSAAGEATPIGWYMDPLGPERAILLPGPAAPGGGLTLRSESAALSRPRAFDLAAGIEIGTGGISAREAGAGTELEVRGVRGPALVRFVAQAGARGVAETVGVTAEYDMSAEEIIARMRAVEAAQERFLKNYTAKATMSYHYRAEALNEAVDYASVNRFYWHAGIGEYEELDVFVNGAHWRGKPPSLPFIEAEKVKEVPIDINLDVSYAYRLEGREALEGHPCWIIAFDPLVEDRTLYSGRVWVDVKTFQRRKVRFVQHGLKEPITSNQDELTYREVEGPDRKYWLPVEGYRQMVFTVLGRNVAVERRVTYEEIQVNPDLFDSQRQVAYLSSRQILRDDEGGLSILEKQSDGTRTVTKESLQNTAIFGGLGFNTKPHVSLPFAGINYFDFDWRGTGTQLDVAFAGILLNVAWTNPKLGETRWEMSLEGRLLGLPGRVRRVTDAAVEEDEDLKLLEERAFATLAHPLTTFSRIEFQTLLTYSGYRRSKHTTSAFVLPADGTTVMETARWRYTRRGYLLSLWAGAGHRMTWSDWGLASGLAGSGDDRDFQKWGFEAIKAFYPGRFQKISLDTSVNAGRRLDRFSRFQIGEFGNIRIRGYNGADITFDRGVSAKVAYQFTLPRGGVSLDLGVEGAVIENDEDFRAASPGVRETVAGGGIGVSWSGPWGTLMSVRTGWALGSSIGVSGGRATSRLVIIKTFDHWPFRRRPAGVPPPPIVP